MITLKELELLQEKVELQEKLEDRLMLTENSSIVGDRIIYLISRLKESDNDSIEEQEEIIKEAEQFINTWE